VELSIIVVNYNTKGLLRSCLASIFEQTWRIALEVFVVDNGSTDGSLEVLAHEFGEVQLIANSVNKGFAAANNQGIKKAAGEYILLLNSDTEILNDAISKTLAFMKQHPEASIAGCKLLNKDGTLQPSCRSFPSVWNLFTESFFLYSVFKKIRLFGQYYMTHFDHESIRQVDVVMGAFMLIRREVFTAIGLLDENYFMYAEETDFCYRARQADYKTFFFPGAFIIHLGGGSTFDNQKQFEQLHSALLLFLHKHFTGIRLGAAVGLKKLGVALRVAIYFLAGVMMFNFQQIRKSRYYLRILF